MADLEEPKSKEEYDFIIWYLLHKNVAVYVSNEDEWFIEFVTPCKWLGKDKMCINYEKRPRVCRKYMADECETHISLDKDYKHIFRIPEEFVDFLKGKGIVLEM